MSPNLHKDSFCLFDQNTITFRGAKNCIKGKVWRIMKFFFLSLYNILKPKKILLICIHLLSSPKPLF